MRQLRAPVLVVQCDKGKENQEPREVPGRRVLTTDLRGILDHSGGGEEYKADHCNFSGMLIDIGVGHIGAAGLGCETKMLVISIRWVGWLKTRSRGFKTHNQDDKTKRERNKRMVEVEVEVQNKLAGNEAFN